MFEDEDEEILDEAPEELADDELDTEDDLGEDSEVEEESEEEDEVDEESLEIERLASQFGQDPLKLAKSVYHSQREIEKRTQEAKANALAADAVLAKLEEITQRVTPKPPAEESPYPGFEPDENGIPTPPSGYWSKVYLPFLIEKYLESFSEEYEDPDVAKSVALAAANEKYAEEKRKYEDWRDSKLTTTKTARATSEEETLRTNGEKQQAVVVEEQTRISGIATRMGYDPEKASNLALEIAKQMVQKAVSDGTISTLKASEPEVGKAAMRQAWDFIIENPDLYDKNLQPDAPGARRSQTPGAAGGASATPTTKRRESGVRYPARHIRFANSLGVTPEELASSQGILRD
jgi:hypothetical protein